jgi:hypothetical protein
MVLLGVRFIWAVPVLLSTYLIRWSVLSRYPEGLPRKFAFVPLVLGPAITAFWYSTSMGLAELGEGAAWSDFIADYMWKGLMSGFFSILMWEAYKVLQDVKGFTWLKWLDIKAWKNAGDDTPKPPQPPVMVGLLLLALVLSTGTAHAQKTLGTWAGSDSIAAACDTNWCGNVYVWPTEVGGTKSYIWVTNLGSAGDLGIAFDKDTTALSGAFGKFHRVGPAESLTLTGYTRTIRVRALRSGTTVPFRISIGR